MSVRPTVHNKVLTRLENNTAEDTIEMARAVSVLIESPGWGFVQDFLTQMVTDVDVQLEMGVHEQAEYAAMVAERRSLRTPQAVAEAIVEAGRRAETHLHELNARLAEETA